MLNAHTHGEWLLLHAHALPEQRLHGVARAVTDGENHRVGADFLCFAAQSTVMPSMLSPRIISRSGACQTALDRPAG